MAGKKRPLSKGKKSSDDKCDITTSDALPEVETVETPREDLGVVPFLPTETSQLHQGLPVVGKEEWVALLLDESLDLNRLRDLAVFNSEAFSEVAKELSLDIQGSFPCLYFNASTGELSIGAGAIAANDGSDVETQSVKRVSRNIDSQLRGQGIEKGVPKHQSKVIKDVARSYIADLREKFGAKQATQLPVIPDLPTEQAPIQQGLPGIPVLPRNRVEPALVTREVEIRLINGCFQSPLIEVEIVSGLEDYALSKVELSYEEGGDEFWLFSLVGRQGTTLKVHVEMQISQGRKSAKGKILKVKDFPANKKIQQWLKYISGLMTLDAANTKE